MRRTSWGASARWSHGMTTVRRVPPWWIRAFSSASAASMSSWSMDAEVSTTTATRGAGRLLVPGRRISPPVERRLGRFHVGSGWSTGGWCPVGGSELTSPVDGGPEEPVGPGDQTAGDGLTGRSLLDDRRPTGRGCGRLRRGDGGSRAPGRRARRPRRLPAAGGSGRGSRCCALGGCSGRARRTGTGPGRSPGS